MLLFSRRQRRTIYWGVPHEWFAWRPVWVTQGHLVWLETVHRTFYCPEEGHRPVIEHTLPMHKNRG